MKLWIRVDACMARDPKVAEFAEAIGSSIPETVGFLTMVWGAMAEHAVDGWIGKEETPTKRLPNEEETPRKPLPNTLIEGYAMWHPKRGRPRGTFAKAFRDLFVGSDGVVGGWTKRQGALIERAEKDRKRKIRGNSSEPPQNLRGDSASTERNGTERETNSAKAGDGSPLRFANWNSTYGAEWAVVQQGDAPFGRIGKALKKLIARDGAEKHWDAWCRFVRSEKAKYGPEYFATHRKDFEPPPVKLALTSSGMSVMTPAESAAYKQAEIDAINAHRVARGDGPLVA